MGSQEKDVRAALLKRALGYEYEERIIEADKNGKSGRVKIIKRHVPPNPKAAEQVLNMMRCGVWDIKD